MDSRTVQNRIRPVFIALAGQGTMISMVDLGGFFPGAITFHAWVAPLLVDYLP